MFAESATIGNEYQIEVMLPDGLLNVAFHIRKKYKAVCKGWNHNHAKVLFIVTDEAGRRLAVALFPKEHIQTLE